ncbi:MAG: aminomethyl-transferring glycine dehydrogenase subunit GcvPA [Thermoguttaceae bacterium]|jgi:glycine dehydrogenase subunit 1
MRYTPNPDAKVDEMLAALGLSSLDDLFADIPTEIRERCLLGELKEETELSVRRHLERLAQDNWSASDAPIFLGAGCYDHYVPAAVDHLLERSEFSTSYTPYQPEINQGILQGLFEYQTFVCSLTGMDVANASLYCGGSALAAACRVAAETTKKRKIFLPSSLHPEYAEIVKSADVAGFYETIEIPITEKPSSDSPSGVINPATLDTLLDDDAAAIVIPYPNFYGCLEPVGKIIELVRAKTKALVIMSVDPFTLALLKPPGEWGADIAVGDAQVLGNRMNYGGPHLGFMAVTKKLLRKIPGRLVGESVDDRGNRCFVLTLQAREQHIRREKANSNICSNQALCALATSMYLTFLGPSALKQAASNAHRLACYAKEKFERAGFRLRYTAPFFREFALCVENPAEANEFLLEYGIIGGYELSEALLLAFTEKRTREEVDELVGTMTEFCFSEIAQDHSSRGNEA